MNLEEFSAEVERELTARGLKGVQQDGRVSVIPDSRTIRYYTTLGLLDRPLISGRQGRYGRRHLLQLLAIKVLQAADLPLAEIQARLYGRSDSELEAIIGSIDIGKPDRVKAVKWQEVVIEPGLRLMAEEGWEPSDSIDDLKEKIGAALAVLGKSRHSSSKR